MEFFIAALVLAINGARWFHATDASSPLKSPPAWTAQRKLAFRFVLIYRPRCQPIDFAIQRENSGAMVPRI